MDRIKDQKVDEEHTITSYDVKSLFTCIPPDDAVEVVRGYLTKDSSWSEKTNLSIDDLCDLVELCVV